MMVAVELRDATEDDIPALVELANQGNPEPTDADEYRRRVASMRPEDIYSRRVAVDGDAVVGSATVDHFPIDPDSWASVMVRVAISARGKGVGHELWSEAEDVARRQGSDLITSQVRDDDEASRGWAERRGFSVWAHRFQSVLDLASFDPAPFADAIERAESAGYSLTTLADVGPGPETWDRFHELIGRLMLLTPDNDSGTVMDRDSFDRFFGDSSIHPPTGLMIAEHDGEWVGLTTLMLRAEGFVYTTFSGVLPEHQGHGVAKLLKVRSTEVARSLGANRMGTHNLSINERILSLNERMGYVRQPGIWLMRKPLS